MVKNFLSKSSETKIKGPTATVFHIMVVAFVMLVSASIIFLKVYKPSPQVQQPKISLEQKMAYLETGEPFAQEQTKLQIPWWMMAIIIGFAVIQILPLLFAAHKSRMPELTSRDLRQIEFLTETPVFLGLLGSLLGVCMTQFITGTLAAPLAYLTTISGILLYLFGRFTILLSLPDSTQSSGE